ncbi:hypothetical protein DICVIV_13268 [Dictyocaulus viviparus]|uniref:Biogenesis of lysosome-related organelles complex 1 subunit 7 n=1 Tax=Dictyocaulus viviparus TaxID=29172 RepID=A0A0D8X884_DICVI|nr:hypothetical protein DICVIV_13268 [Dictyocaulus viviparus]
MSSEDSAKAADAESDMVMGMMSAIEPAIERFDAQVISARESQALLAARIQELSDVLHVMGKVQACDFDSYSRKLNESSRRVANTCRILENVHERLTRMQREISRETYLKKENVTL